jgi:HAD superfamily hydrolase (TIGR01490 family)
MAGSSGIFFAKAAFETGMITRRRLVKDLYENLRFRLVGSTDDRAAAVRIRVGQMIEGVPVRELERLAPRVLAGVLPRIYPDMLARAYAHQDAGRLVFIVTAASQEMANLLAHVLAFDGGLGSRSEVVDGVYTGKADGPFNYRDGKRASLQELAALKAIDLDASYAYSDSESDLPMLRAVGHPVAVNPDAELLAVALEEDWEVVRLDRLGRRLKLIAAVGAASVAAAGAAAGQSWRRSNGARAGNPQRGGDSRGGGSRRGNSQRGGGSRRGNSQRGGGPRRGNGTRGDGPRNGDRGSGIGRGERPTQQWRRQ